MLLSCLKLKIISVAKSTCMSWNIVVYASFEVTSDASHPRLVLVAGVKLPRFAVGTQAIVEVLMGAEKLSKS